MTDYDVTMTAGGIAQWGPSPAAARQDDHGHI